MIQKFLITASDITNSHTMFSPNLTGTKGNIVQQNPDRVAIDYVAVSKDFMKPQKFVTLVADVMFVNGAPFLITVSRCTNFVTVEDIPTPTAKQLSKYLKYVYKIYYISSMIVKTVFMDMDFDKTIEDPMINIVVNNSAAK